MLASGSAIFGGEVREPPKGATVTRTFARRVRDAGLPTLTLHGLRQTFATLVIRAGVPVKVVSECLGHARIATTSDLNQHVYVAMQGEATEAVARLLGSQPDACATARWQRTQRSPSHASHESSPGDTSMNVPLYGHMHTPVLRSMA